MARKHPCIDIIRKQVGEDKLSDDQATELIDEILGRMKNMDEAHLSSVEDTVKKIAGEIKNEKKLGSAIAKRNALLTVKAMRQVDEFVAKHPTKGEGLRAYLDKSPRNIEGARLSIDSQVVGLKHKYVGKLLAGLEESETVGEFRNGSLDKEIIQELWHIRDPDVSNPSGSKKALSIAKVIHNLQTEMVARENRAGGYINSLDNYVMRQSHDPTLIRRAGGVGFGKGSAEASLKAWSEFTLPLLNPEKTFGSQNPKLFMKNVHEGILSGVHGRSQSSITSEFVGAGALAKKVSHPRVLHFKDADSFYLYNKTFGSRTVRDGILSDLRKAAHNTALMENLGPNPEMTFNNIVRKMKESSRGTPDDLAQLRSLDSPGLKASFQSLMGHLDMPANPTWHGITKGLQTHAVLTKLGGITLSAVPDKAFFHSAGTYQGIRNMDLFLEQFNVFVPKTKQEKIRLHLMGAAIDGFLGDSSARYAAGDNTGGRLFKLQQLMFKINGMNWWNDIHKGSFAKLTAANLGEHADLRFSNLPSDLNKTLKLYGITDLEWDVIRTTVFEAENGIKYITPDKIGDIPDAHIERLLAVDNVKSSPNNILRARDRLSSKLFAFVTDQVDDAVVTPGNRERVIANWGTQAGTPIGSAVRLLMHFKSFPITVYNRIIKREIYGHTATSFKSWLLKDRHANFRMLQLIAMTTVGGYVSMSVKDALKGRTPRRLFNDDGSFNHKVLISAMQRGGGLGIYGDFLLTEYDRSYRNFWNTASGPILGQIPEIAALGTDIIKGKDITRSAEKLGLSNTPFINLFYIRPALDYIILWNLQEMLDPGSLSEMERNVEETNNQGFFISPLEAVR